jgi:hypothetical protein
MSCAPTSQYMRRDLASLVDDGAAGLVERRAADRNRARAAGQSGRCAVGVAHDHIDVVGIDAKLIGDDLLVRGEKAGAVFLVAHDQLDPVVFELDRRGFGETAAAALGIGGHADAAQLSSTLATFTALGKGRPIGRRHAAIHHLLEFAGIEHELGYRGVGHGRGRHEIHPPDSVRSHAKLARRRVDDALQEVGGFRPSGAAIGADRHRVGADAFHIHMDGADHVQAGHEIARPGRHECPEW